MHLCTFGVYMLQICCRYVADMLPICCRYVGQKSKARLISYRFKIPAVVLAQNHEEARNKTSNSKIFHIFHDFRGKFSVSFLILAQNHAKNTRKKHEIRKGTGIFLDFFTNFPDFSRFFAKNHEKAQNESKSGNFKKFRKISAPMLSLCFFVIFRENPGWYIRNFPDFSRKRRNNEGNWKISTFFTNFPDLSRSSE